MRILKANERRATDFPILGDFDAGNSAPHGLIGVIFEEQPVLSFMLKAKGICPCMARRRFDPVEPTSGRMRFK